MKTLKHWPGEGFFDKRLQVHGSLLDELGTLQVSSLVKTYGLGVRKVVVNTSAETLENILQITLVEYLHSRLTNGDHHRRALGLTYLELVNLEFCLAAARDELQASYRPSINLVRNLTRDRGLLELPRESINLGRSTFDKKFDEFMVLLPEAFFLALKEKRYFVTGAAILDGYITDMVTTLKSMREFQ